MKRTVWLVRHPPVTLAWQKRCYGQSDPGLSREGARLASDLIDTLAKLSPDIVIHSGLRRTRAIAEALARRTGATLLPEPRWRERHFGEWEGQSWHAIYRATGNAMDGMLTEPHSFRPGGGETTAEMWDRTWLAWEALPPCPRIAVISHGGPIACVRALRQNGTIDLLPKLIPAPGEILTIELVPMGIENS